MACWTSSLDVDWPAPDHNAINKAFDDTCERRSFIPEEYFWNEIVHDVLRDCRHFLAFF
jgi:hypothetical protein